VAWDDGGGGERREEKEERGRNKNRDGGETCTRMGPLDPGRRSGYEFTSISDALYHGSGLASIATGRKELGVSSEPIRPVFLLDLLLLLPHH
jgi:hypothetical protein